MAQQREAIRLEIGPADPPETALERMVCLGSRWDIEVRNADYDLSDVQDRPRAPFSSEGGPGAFGGPAGLSPLPLQTVRKALSAISVRRPPERRRGHLRGTGNQGHAHRHQMEGEEAGVMALWPGAFSPHALPPLGGDFGVRERGLARVYPEVAQHDRTFNSRGSADPAVCQRQADQAAAIRRAKVDAPLCLFVRG
jgi:hypothetical protein